MIPLHEAVIDAFAMASHQADEVVAAYVGGSIGAGRSDALSDVDCKLVFTDSTARDRAWTERADWFARLGDVVVAADATHIGGHLQVGVLAGPVMVDLAYHTPSELVPSAWHAGLRIVKDPLGIAKGLEAESSSMRHPEADPDSLTNLSRQFWRWAVFTARDIRRGDVTDVLACLAFLRNHALRRLAAAASGLPWHRFERLEAHVDPDLLEHLRAGTPVSLDPPALEAALRSQVEAFRSLRAAVQARVPHPVDVDEEACIAAFEAMLAGDAPSP